ncbi:NnrS family protein [Limnoglobus roseus]|uniref:Carbohydrate translocase n=1 Tax=Limnoglobus roseus TaxID=2598579 RepID=A0A5C1AC55_9BACT|nr:NnrS family protein [Limnoglobus roseus]QEL15763.1 carbohydrate translocase [Limnoglobus roseus]
MGDSTPLVPHSTFLKGDGASDAPSALHGNSAEIRDTASDSRTPPEATTPSLEVKASAAAVPPAQTRWPVRLAWYVAVTVICFLLPLVGYRMDVNSFHAPLLYDEDALLILPMVKSTIETGTHWHTDRLGAPGVQEMYDFPVIDHLHFAIIWLIGRVTPDPVFVFNLYYLLGYPLAGLAAMAVLRHFGLSFFAAATGGVLYAVQPYHFYRGECHYFLSAYFFVPVTCMVILWVAGGRLPGFPLRADGRRRFCLWDRDTLAAVVIGILTAASGAYYAFFAAGLMLGAGLYGWAALKTWRAMASAVLMIGVIFVAGVANHAPQFMYQAKNGKHTAPTERYSEEAEHYGLKLTQLLMPIDDHRLRVLSEIKSSYNSYDRPVQAITERYGLGFLGACGLMILLVRLVLPMRRTSPYAELTAVTAFAILIGTVGGFGAIFNHVVTPQVRCYNRIAIYIAFFALFSILYALDAGIVRASAWVECWSSRRVAGIATMAAWLALTVCGVLDQTPVTWGDEIEAKLISDQQLRFRTDEMFFHQIEDALNPDGTTPGAMVFQLPYVRWPESPPVRNLASYEHARGYVHTNTLRWSYGCMKGRETDEWCRHVSILPPEQLLEHVVKAGFDGLMLDKRGYPPAKADQMEREIVKALGHATATPTVTHPHKDQLFFDLRPYRNWLRGAYGSGWEAACYNELHRVRVLWLNGFSSFKDSGYEWQHRWCRPKGLAVFVNPTNETKTFTAQFFIRTMTKNPAVLSIRGGDLWTEDLTIDPDTPMLTRTFTVPPGRHNVNFSFAVPESYTPHDGRWLVFYFSGLRLE